MQVVVELEYWLTDRDGRVFTGEYHPFTYKKTGDIYNRRDAWRLVCDKPMKHAEPYKGIVREAILNIGPVLGVNYSFRALDWMEKQSGRKIYFNTDKENKLLDKRLRRV